MFKNQLFNTSSKIPNIYGFYTKLFKKHFSFFIIFDLKKYVFKKTNASFIKSMTN